MKKIVIFMCALAAAVSASYAKDAFVPQSQIMKAEKPGKSKQWSSSSRLFEKDLSGGKTSSGAWAVEGGELKSKSDKPLYISGLKGQYSVCFEFQASEDAEGSFFVRAPKGDVSKAVRIKLCCANGKPVDSIGSINGALAPREKFEETKDGRWSRVWVFVEGDNLRVSPGDKICRHYADRRFLTYTFSEIAEKGGSPVAAEGEAGFVCTKGEIKVKNVWATQL